MKPTVYIDTSVVGGAFDEEFKLWTNLFFKAVRNGEYKIAVSSILKEELLNAPERVKNFLSDIPDEQIVNIKVIDEAIERADLYLDAGITGRGSLADCTHIATATVYKIDILISWNFKHIVNLNKIKLYNGVNIQHGYGNLEIRTPRELLDYDN